MILSNGHSTQYLNDYKDGLIQMGKGIGCKLDEHLLWKDSQLNIILGHDNVGKSYWILWYYLTLMKKHELTFTLFMDENYHGKIFRDLIQLYYGIHFKDLTYKQIRSAEAVLENFFKVVDNTRRYSPKELLEVFHGANTSTYLIDPFNGLKSNMNYSENYEVLNEFKMFTKTQKKTLYINAHPSSASGRRSAVYPDKHEWAGQVMPPLKSDIEGGKPFANKADDFIIIHRMLKNEAWRYYTMIEVDKIKDVDTGGKQTNINDPIMCYYNYGKGFIVDGVNPLHEEQKISSPNISNGFKFNDDLPF